MITTSPNEEITVIRQAIQTVLDVATEDLNQSRTFVELGGDSLSAIRVSAECQKQGITITTSHLLRRDTLQEVIQKLADSASPAIRRQKLASAPLEQLENINAAVQHVYPSGTSLQEPEFGITAQTILDRVDTTELTELQILLLKGSIDSPKLNTVTVRDTYSGIDLAAILTAWRTVILSEPIFGDVIRQLSFSPEQFLPCGIVEVEDEVSHSREAHSAVCSFGLVSRMTAIYQAQSQTTTVVWRIHHAFMDGYSAGLLREKIRLFLLGSPAPAGQSFRETMQCANDLLDLRKSETELFWSEKMEANAKAVNELRVAPQRVRTESSDTQQAISIQLSNADIITASARTGYTKAVYFAAAWALTLGKFMDADNVSFGMVFSGRDLPVPGAIETIGPMISTLPLFISIRDSGASVNEFLRAVHEAILELKDHQHSASLAGRQYQSVMATQFDTPSTNNWDDMQSGLPLNIIIGEAGRVDILYAANIYANEDINNIRDVFIISVESLMSGQSTALASLGLPLTMKEQVMRWGNCESVETLDASKGDDLVTLFESSVAKYPHDLAIVQGGLELTYDLLDRTASVIALQLSWIQPNEPVCVYADRSVNWLIAIYGVLKAGGVYAPLDPSAPVARREANFKRSGARAVVVPARASHRLVLPERSEEFSYTYLVVEDILEETPVCGQRARKLTQRSTPRPDDLAYICFTSGSTGEPKAVQCTHKGLVAFQKDRTVRLESCRGIVVGQVMSPVFDGSIHEIFSALSYGATLLLAAPDQDEPFSHLQHCDSAILTPSIAKVLDPDQFPRLQNVYLVGEAVSQPVCDAWGVSRALYNMYGPTEATCGATIKRLLPNEPVSLGRVNQSSRAYILDRNGCLLPPGAVGEIYLAGIQVSAGYINLPVENANRFLKDSIMPETFQKMYRTGDFGY